MKIDSLINKDVLQVYVHKKNLSTQINVLKNLKNQFPDNEMFSSREIRRIIRLQMRQIK